MSIYRREIDTQCCNQWMNGIRTINGQYPDDNRDFDINAGSGISIQPASGGITIINSAQAQSFVAGDNIEITPSGSDLEIRVKDDIAVDNIDVSQDADITGNVNVGGDLNVSGDIIQQGSSYETHAEQVYTTKDYIIMRDGAVGALAAGSYSGFQVKKYDGTNDGRLVIDKDGIARVGDVGDEQSLMTRDESADMTGGNLIEWDATNNKAVDAGTNVSAINTAIDGKISGTGNIGSDTKPVKIVNGQAVAVTNNLLTTVYSNTIINIDGMNIYFSYIGGKLLIIQTQNASPAAAGDFTLVSGIQNPLGLVPILNGAGQTYGYLFGSNNSVVMRILPNADGIGFRAVYWVQ